MIERKSLADLCDEMRAVARGDREAPPPPATTTLFSILTAEVFELLHVLATTSTTTLSGLAHWLGKPHSDVSRTLQRLAVFGIVRLKREGREVRCELVATELKINLVDKTVAALQPRGFPLCPREP